MTRRPILITAISLATLILVTGVAWAATLAFDADWHALTGGGGQATGGGYTLSAAIGQPLAGEVGDTNIRLRAGFLSAFVATPPHPTPAYWLYLPLNMR
jgi:hypothetical protein